MKIEEHKKKFGNQAENYTKYRKPYDTDLYDFLFSLTPKTPIRILDIACGTGKSTEPLVRVGVDVSGIDHDPLMIFEGKKQAELKNLKIEYSVGSAESLPFESDSFDVITVGTAFHWFVNEKAMSEIIRVLKKDGLLFVYWTLTTKEVPDENSIPSDFFKSFDWDRVPSELRDLTNISDFLSKNNLEQVSTKSIEFSHCDTVEEQVGLMKTASSYEILSEEEKNRFVKELTDLLSSKLRNRNCFPFEEEIQICYGFKK